MSEEQLKEEVERLKRELAIAKRSQRNTEFSARQEMFKGHPVLVFEGPSLIRPMTLGIGKLKAVTACLTTVQAFLRKQENQSNGTRAGDAEQI
jgi:hypothetical protein